MAAALGSLPCIAISLVLAFFSEPVFGLLLGNAAVMPQAVSWLLIVLLAANLVQTVSNFVLVHTGYFHVIARLSILISIAMTIVTVVAVAARVDIVGFFQVYAAGDVSSALCYLTLALRGPLRKKG